MRKYLQGLSQFIYTPRSPHQKINANIRSILKPETTAKPQCVHCATKEGEQSEEKLEKHSEPKSPSRRPTVDQLFHTMVRSTYKPDNKVTVFGAGAVGTATIFSLLAKGITNDISMIDFNENILKAELMDLQSGSKFLPDVRIQASKDYAISSESKICVLTASGEGDPDDEHFDGLKTNAEVLRVVVPQILKYSPNAIILVAVDPVDELSHLAWRASGLPPGRVVGAGTNRASAAFRFLLAARLGIAPGACSGYILGENGKSGVVAWSSVCVGGIHLQTLHPDIGTDADEERWQEVHHQLLQAEETMRELKGHSSWASALAITDICAAILNNSNCIRPVSTYVKGEYDINEEVFLSLPCVLGCAGVADVIKQPLTPTEVRLLQKSAEAVAAQQEPIIKIVQ